jgi:hypothetical protein
MIEHAMNREWQKRELLKGRINSHSITFFTPRNDVSNLSIHTSPMVMKSEKAISTFNSKVFKLQVYLLNKTKPFMWWKNHFVALW